MSAVEPQTKAITAVADAGKEAVKALRDAGGYLARVFGSAPDDLVGYLFGDRLKVARAEQLARLAKRVEAINNERGVEAEAVSRSISIPLLVAASDETRDELLEIWARLLAAASDPNRRRHFRIGFIELVKQLDPLDIAMMQEWGVNQKNVQLSFDGVFTVLAPIINAARTEVFASRENLTRLGLLREFPTNYFTLSATGCELIAAVSDRKSD